MLADRRALARAGDAAQSAVLRLHDAQRARRVPRLPVVLLHQRAVAALPEPALSARLQHRAAALFLAVSPGMAISVERVFSRCSQAFLQTVDRAGKTRLLALCWIGFILVFFTFSTTQEYYSMPCYPAMALLLGSAIAAGGKWVWRGTRALTVIAGLRGRCCDRHPGRGSQCPGRRRHLARAQPASRRLHAVAGAHGRPYATIICVSSTAAGGGCGCTGRRVDRYASGTK